MKDGANPRATLLLVDDEPGARDALGALLTQEGFRVHCAGDGEEALERCDELAPDVVLTDLHMPRKDGLELLEALRKKHPGLPVLLLTAHGDVNTAVKAMRAGAEDYLLKPVDIEEVQVVLHRVLERRDLRSEAEHLRRQLRTRDKAGLEGMLGGSPAMQKVYQLATRVAPARATVLLTGESGTGKGEVAKAIHALSPRADKPFVSLHCAALAESLLESELFGHEKGSFTGADRRRIGRFEAANGGTLFLDEVGEIPPSVQVKLLRVLQERKLERVGGNETLSVDVRLIAATNKDLSREVLEHRFREDLYYRLNVVHIEMPPLRARGRDVLLLAEHFLRRFAQDNLKRATAFSDAAVARLLAYPWPGNVRELENAVERAVVLSEGTQLEAADLPLELAATPRGGVRIPGSTMAELERYAILTTLDAVNGSTTRAAEMLGLSVRTIQYRLHDYGLAGKKEPGEEEPKGDRGA